MDPRTFTGTVPPKCVHFWFSFSQNVLQKQGAQTGYSIGLCTAPICSFLIKTLVGRETEQRPVPIVVVVIAEHLTAAFKPFPECTVEPHALVMFRGVPGHAVRERFRSTRWGIVRAQAEEAIVECGGRKRRVELLRN